MIICPYCNAENIEGADACEQCGLSLSDLNLPVPASEVERSLLVDRVSSLVSRPPVTAAPTTPVRDVVRILDERAVGCVVIVEQGQPVGIFSERDVLLKIGADADAVGQRPVSEFMTPNPQSLPPDAKIAFAVHRMDLGGFRHIPIVSAEQELIGVISVRDILRYLTETHGRLSPTPWTQLLSSRPWITRATTSGLSWATRWSICSFLTPRVSRCPASCFQYWSRRLPLARYSSVNSS